MSHELQRDLVCLLPNELVFEIFEVAFRDNAPPRAPISRALLPLQRKALYRLVKLVSFAQLESLASACKTNPRLRGLVVSLDLVKVEFKEPEEVNRIRSLLLQLVNLEHLKLGSYFLSFVKFILATRAARTSLARLRNLEVDDPFGLEKPCDRILLRHLDNLPSLHRLEIVYTGSANFFCPLAIAQVTSVEELVLRGGAVDHVETSTLVGNFPNLTSLTLDTRTSFRPDYVQLVALLPHRLTSLTLRTLALFDRYSKPCDLYLTRFSYLVSLYLGAGTFSQDPMSFLRELLNLRILGFGHGAILDTTELERLLASNELVNLEKVIFDQIEGKVGWRIEEDSDGATLHPDSESEENRYHVGPGWVLPKWNPVRGRSFKERDVEALVGRLRARGLVIEGTTVEAFGVLEEWRIEIRMCAMAHAEKVGVFDECRRRFGDAMVDAMLLAKAVEAGDSEE